MHLPKNLAVPIFAFAVFIHCKVISNVKCVLLWFQ